MPRANRCFLPEHTWHITHRCHKREFLLKFKRDRMNWKRWLFIAKKRFGLCVLNYIVTSNHIHLLVAAKGHDEISKSMQLVAGRTAQEYNARKKRKGAFLEDRYHTIAVDTESYLFRCMVYIDLNMVRTGVVNHPNGWDVTGHTEIQSPPSRYRIIGQAQLMPNVSQHTNLKISIKVGMPNRILKCMAGADLSPLARGILSMILSSNWVLVCDPGSGKIAAIILSLRKQALSTGFLKRAIFILKWQL